MSPTAQIVHTTMLAFGPEFAVAAARKWVTWVVRTPKNFTSRTGTANRGRGDDLEKLAAHAAGCGTAAASPRPPSDKTEL